MVEKRISKETKQTTEKTCLICNFNYTSAGIRTRVRALATPGDDRYTTDVIWCPDPDSNRGQLPLQGSALPLSYLGRQINFTTFKLLFKGGSVFYLSGKISGKFLSGPAEIRTQDLRHVKATS